MNKSLPPQEYLENLPIATSPGTFDFYTKRKFQLEKAGSKEIARVLFRDVDLAEALEIMYELKISARELLVLASHLKTIPPPIRKKGETQVYYVYPDHFEALAAPAVMRKHYLLPLTSIQAIMEHLSPSQGQVITHRRISPFELLDLVKMSRAGFTLSDVVMSNACDILLKDMISPDKQVLLALEPGEALLDKEKELLLRRISELKSWITSNRRATFVAKESRIDLKELRASKSIEKKLQRKAKARLARQNISQ